MMSEEEGGPRFPCCQRNEKKIKSKAIIWPKEEERERRRGDLSFF